MCSKRVTDFCQKFKKILYNPEDHSVLTRTAGSWGLIFLFYAVFYTSLASFFCGFMAIFQYIVIDEHVPGQTGMHSLLLLNPGLQFAPQVSTDNTLISVTLNPQSSNEKYLSKTVKFLESYTENDTTTVICTPGQPLPEEFPSEKPCRFDVNILGECADPEQAIQNKRPCVFLTLNRIFGWFPDTDKRIILNCTGRSKTDTERLGQPVYHPSWDGSDNKTYGVIGTQYFPFTGNKYFQKPAVAVQFPDMARDIAVQVECTVHDVRNADSSTKFEMKVDTK